MTDNNVPPKSVCKATKLRWTKTRVNLRCTDCTKRTNRIELKCNMPERFSSFRSLYTHLNENRCKPVTLATGMWAVGCEFVADMFLLYLYLCVTFVAACLIVIKNILLYCARLFSYKGIPNLAAHRQYHRLNGSSSPVLTATSLSYGKAKNSTPTESKPLTWFR